MIRKLLLTLIFLVIGAAAVLWLGSSLSLDHQYTHTAASARLPEFSPALASSPSATLVQIPANNMTFRARVAGFPGREGNVMLLHGFPETSIMYEETIKTLAAAGYAVVAFDQRGYSPGARPDALSAYAVPELISDVFAVADAVGFANFHLAGHDWGAAVGWLLVMQDDSRINSWAALSIPHLIAYAEAMAADPDQQQRSSYINFFRTPVVPEVLFTFNNLQLLRSSVYAEHPDAVVAEYEKVFAEPGALTAALNWYRAGDFRSQDSGALFAPEISIPTLFIWGAEDPVVGQAALEMQQPYFIGPYREVELDTGHWLTQTRDTAVNAALLSHLQSVAGRPHAE